MDIQHYSEIGQEAQNEKSNQSIIMEGIARVEMELYNLYLPLIPDICHHLEGSDFTKCYSTLFENLINL